MGGIMSVERLRRSIVIALIAFAACGGARADTGAQRDRCYESGGNHYDDQTGACHRHGE